MIVSSGTKSLGYITTKNLRGLRGLGQDVSVVDETTTAKGPTLFSTLLPIGLMGAMCVGGVWLLTRPFVK